MRNYACKKTLHLQCLIFHKRANTLCVPCIYSNKAPCQEGRLNVELNVILFSRKFCPVSISVLGEKKQVKLSVIHKKIISNDTVSKI